MEVGGIDGFRCAKRGERQEPASKHQIQSGRGEFMSGLTRDVAAESVSIDQINFRRERDQGNNFSCSGDFGQDWQ